MSEKIFCGRPEIIEIGDAREMTLGMDGPTADGCDCTKSHSDDEDGPLI